MNTLTNFWNMVLTQRSWSWAFAGIGYLLFFLLMRHFFMRGLAKRAKSLNSKWFHEIKKVYIRKCIAGWVIFLASLLLFIFFWQTANFKVPSLYEVGVVFIISLAILVAIISHLSAFAIATIHVLKQLENNQMSL